MSSLKSFDKYSPSLKEAYLEREAGLKELAELRGKRTSISLQAKDQSASPADKDPHSSMTGSTTRMPITHTTFKNLITKVRVKSETLVISGMEHLGVIHDLCYTENPKIFRFFGDRYMASVSFETTPATILNMKETKDRRFFS